MAGDPQSQRQKRFLHDDKEIIGPRFFPDLCIQLPDTEHEIATVSVI